MTMITPSYLGETIEYSSLHACRSTLEDPTPKGLYRLTSNPKDGKSQSPIPPTLTFAVPLLPSKEGRFPSSSGQLPPSSRLI